MSAERHNWRPQRKWLSQATLVAGSGANFTTTQEVHSSKKNGLPYQVGDGERRGVWFLSKIKGGVTNQKPFMRGIDRLYCMSLTTWPMLAAS
jgi:hypothetical protein